MAFFKFVLTVGLFSLASADVSEIVGKNQYLPPNKGYNYDRPSIPFPSPSAAGSTPSFQAPFPSGPSSPFPSGPSGPSGPSFQTATPSYKPPVSSYGPPLSTPRPSVPRPLPTFRPSAGYQPGASPSGTQGTFIAPSAGGGEHDHHHDHHEPGMPYDFAYKVKDDYFGTDYYRNEVSDGDVIKGEYRVQLPDGRLQIVRYTADWKNGFNADVSYEGQPRYPDQPNYQGAGSSQYPSGSGQSPNAYIPPAKF